MFNKFRNRLIRSGKTFNVSDEEWRILHRILAERDHGEDVQENAWKTRKCRNKELLEKWIEKKAIDSPGLAQKLQLGLTPDQLERFRILDLVLVGAAPAVQPANAPIPPNDAPSTSGIILMPNVSSYDLQPPSPPAPSDADLRADPVAASRAPSSGM